MASMAAPSQAFTQFSPSTNQVSTIAAASCAGQLDTTVLALTSSGYAADAAGLIAETAGALDPTGISEAIAVGTQASAWILTVAGYALDYDATHQRPSCEQDFYGSVKVTAGGTNVTGNSIFNNNLQVTGALGVSGDANIASSTYVAGSGSGSILSIQDSGVILSGNGATILLNGTSASLLNSTGHGLSITATQTTLSGGTNSSSLTLMDSQATLGVGTAVAPQVILINATNSGGGVTSVTIGTAAAGNTNNLVGGVNNIGTGIENTQNNIGNLTTSANAISGVTNAITASTTNTLTAGTNNVITATSGSNTISSAAGANQVVTYAANAAIGTTIQGTGTTSGVSLAGTSGGQTAILTLGKDNRYGTGSPVANFSTTGGAPIRVTGVADGQYDLDAVNMRQLTRGLKIAYSGVASVAAMAGLPDPIPGKRFSFGLGVGQYEGHRAAAAGFKGIVSDNLSMTASVAISGVAKTYSTGMGYSW